MGALLFLGVGVAANMLPAPMWIALIDPLLAYAPPALLGHALATRGRRPVRPAG